MEEAHLSRSPRSRQTAKRDTAVDATTTRKAPPSHSEMIAMQWQSERGDLDLDNFLLAIYFMRLGTLVDRAYDRHCQKEYGIGGGDMRVMLALRRSGPPYVKRPTDLFRALLVTSGAITKKVDRLEAVGFVERLTDPTHAGGFLVHLTKKGLQVVENAVEYLANRSVLAPAMVGLTPEERKKGSEFALRVLSTLENSHLFDEDEPEEPATRKKKAKR
jgi:DNA-binding MarR family transcriptional regulator